MKKNVMKCVVMAAVAAMTMTFAACGDDDEPIGGIENVTNPDKGNSGESGDSIQSQSGQEQSDENRDSTQATPAPVPDMLYLVPCLEWGCSPETVKEWAKGISGITQYTSGAYGENPNMLRYDINGDWYNIAYGFNDGKLWLVSVRLVSNDTKKKEWLIVETERRFNVKLNKTVSADGYSSEYEAVYDDKTSIYIILTDYSMGINFTEKNPSRYTY